MIEWIIAGTAAVVVAVQVAVCVDIIRGELHDRRNR